MSGREAPAPFLHASQHAPGGTDEVANLRAAVRRQRITAGMGLITETCQRGMIATSANGTSGQFIGNPVYMFAGEVFTDLVAECSILGSGMTLFKFGVFSLDNVQRAASADVKASFGSTGEKSVSLVTPYPAPVDGFYYVGFIGVGGTIPAIARLAGGPTGGAPFGVGTVYSGVQQTGQSDLPATLSITQANIMYWLGVK